MVKHPTDELRTLNGFFVKSCVSPTVQCTQYQYGSNFYLKTVPAFSALQLSSHSRDQLKRTSWSLSTSTF